MNIDYTKCYAFISDSNSNNLRQCMFNKMDLTDNDCLFCIRHQRIFDRNGKLKNGYYKIKNISINIISNINDNINYNNYKKLKQQLNFNTNYNIKKY